MIYINWHPGLGNTPTIELHIGEGNQDFFLLPPTSCNFENKHGVWWHVQSNGLVQYFAHNGTPGNNGGYGGGPIDFMHDGVIRRLWGPWSSRASFVGMIAGVDMADVIIRQHSTARGMRTGILLEKLQELWDCPFYLVRLGPDEDGEFGGFTASVRPDRIEKPDGHVIDDWQNRGIEVHAGVANDSD